MAKKIKFKVVKKAINIINRLDINLDFEFEDPSDFGNKVLVQAIKKFPEVDDECLDLINEICESDFDEDSDIFEIVEAVKVNFAGMFAVFQSAFKLKNTGS